MSKPAIKEVLEIEGMKKEASDLYDEIDRRVEEMRKAHGEGRFDYDLEELLDTQDGDEFDESLVKDGRYLKFEIIDNVAALQDGETIFKSVAFKPVTFSARSLKRCPDSLK